MEQPTFTFDAPFQGRTPQTRHASRSGAMVCRSTSQRARMLVLYLERGPSSDGELARQMGLPEGRISARRAGLLTDGLVCYVDMVRGPYGAAVTRYELTEKGLQIARHLRTENER